MPQLPTFCETTLIYSPVNDCLSIFWMSQAACETKTTADVLNPQCSGVFQQIHREINVKHSRAFDVRLHAQTHVDFSSSRSRRADTWFLLDQHCRDLNTKSLKNNKKNPTEASTARAEDFWNT